MWGADVGVRGRWMTPLDDDDRAYEDWREADPRLDDPPTHEPQPQLQSHEALCGEPPRRCPVCRKAILDDGDFCRQCAPAWSEEEMR